MNGVRFTCLDDASHVSDIAFVLSEAKKATNALGFIPKPGIERHARNGKIALLERNDDLVGFAVFSTRKDGLRLCVNQCYVRPDARMIENGRELVRALQKKWPHARVELSCAADLAAVFFWSAIGFFQAKILKPANTRKRAILRFVHPPLTQSLLWLPSHEELDEPSQPGAGCIAQSTNLDLHQLQREAMHKERQQHAE